MDKLLCTQCIAKPRRAINQSWCADCHAAYHRNYRKTHPEKYSTATEKRKAGWKARATKWSKAHKEIKYAHYAVWHAQFDGILVRPSKCEKCGTKCKPQAHHYKGYAKEHALDVKWLCAKCHRNI